MKVSCQISVGELIDKLSILWIKSKKVQDQNKLEHIEHEKVTLEKTLNRLGLDKVDSFLEGLIEVNSRLWEIEDLIRIKESKKEFDDEFIKLARSVYFENDSRFDLKNEINELYGSDIREMKSYQKYN